MNNEVENQIEVSTLLEIIYELYREDIKRGKIRDEIFKECKQAVGKSATESQTFHQTAFIYKE